MYLLHEFFEVCALGISELGGCSCVNIILILPTLNNTTVPQISLEYKDG